MKPVSASNIFVVLEQSGLPRLESGFEVEQESSY